MGQIQGGYINFRAGEILSLLIAYKEGLRPAAIRLYLAGHLEATEKHFTPTHEITLKTLCERAELAPRTAQEALRELKTGQLLTLENGTLTFCPEITPEAEPYTKELKTSPNRPVPIPRSMIRELAAHSTGSEIVGALAHFMRCLFIKNGEINSVGFVKPSLIGKLTGLGKRAIKSARSWLKDVGFLSDHEADQWAINKFGGCFSVTLTPKFDPALEANNPPQESSKYVKFAPPLERASIFSLNNDLNNQYIQPMEVNPTYKSGVCKQTLQEPTLKDVKLEDLKEMTRLETLYRQAVERNWLQDCEASIINFVGAAARSVTVEGNPVKVFVGLVKKGLWGYITQAQEDTSLKALNRYRAQNPEAFTKQSTFRMEEPPKQLILDPRPRLPQKECRPERIIFRANAPMPPRPAPKPSQNLTPVSEIITALLAKGSFSPVTT
jgi:hypothetical protein